MKYFYTDGQNKYGPCSIDELRSKIEANTFVWREGMNDWDKAENVDELRSLFFGTIPPPIPSNHLSLSKKRKDNRLLIMAIIGLLASFWFLIVGTAAFNTSTHLDEGTYFNVVVSLYSVAFSIVVIVKSILQR